ncbi:MAG: phosphate/phosphite/phosphonate ABC transporter substrate-binding protein [Phycisphaerae bacterium]
MRWSATLRTATIAAVAALAAGCRSGGLPLFNLLGIDKPLVVAIGVEKLPILSDRPIDPIVTWAQYEPFRDAMSRNLARPVALDMTLPALIPPLLADGFYQVAILTPAAYAKLPENTGATPLAVPLDAANRAARPALLVVPHDSQIRKIEDLKSRTVAFGPDGDARAHLAALMLLKQHGLKPTDLSLELLPIPGSLKHMPDGRAVAQTVINGSSQAGFIDQAAWDELAEKASSSGEPGRDRLHVIGQTIAVPDRVVVASPKLDAQVAARVREFLTTGIRENPKVLEGLKCSGYGAPTPEALEACKQVANSE